MDVEFLVDIDVLGDRVAKGKIFCAKKRMGVLWSRVVCWNWLYLWDHRRHVLVEFVGGFKDVGLMERMLLMGLVHLGIENQ